MVIHVLSCISILYVNIHKHDADNGCFLYLINISCLLVRQPHRYHCPFKAILFFKVEFFLFSRLPVLLSHAKAAKDPFNVIAFNYN